MHLLSPSSASALFRIRTDASFSIRSVYRPSHEHHHSTVINDSVAVKLLKRTAVGTNGGNSGAAWCLTNTLHRSAVVTGMPLTPGSDTGSEQEVQSGLRFLSEPLLDSAKWKTQHRDIR